MWHVLNLEWTVMALVDLVLLAIKIFAFVNCLMYSAQSYEAANKLNKTAWAIGLGLGVAVQFVGMPTFVNIAFTIAALVYLADVRPALASLTRR